MSLFDVILALVIFGFTLFGFWFGLVQTLGSTVGTIFGVYFASRWYIAPANWVADLTGWETNFTRVAAFIILFIIINRLIGFIFYLLDRTFGIVLRFPFIKSLSRLLGAALGLFEGIIVLGIFFYFISRFPLSAQYMSLITESQVVPIVTRVGAILWPLVPEAVRQLSNALENIIH